MMLWEGKDLACFLHYYIPSTYCASPSANSVSSIVDQNPCSYGAYILVEETGNSCLKQMNDVISSTDEYFKK